MNISKQTSLSKAQIKTNLGTGFFTDASLKVRVYDEIQIPCYEGKQCRFDYLTTERPKLNQKAQYEYRGDLLETRGFELKISKSDLLRDAKFTNYLGATNYFSFCVPSNLVLLAVEKLKPFPQIGIVDIETMQVIKPAKRVDVLPVKRLQVFAQILTK